MNSIYINLLILFSLTGCSLYKKVVTLPKYSIVTSVKGANVYSSKGKLLGQTPLKFGYKEIQDGIDGEFATLILEKDGYLSRVVFFEAERSVELKIDLKRDEFFQDNKYKLLEGRNELLSNENLFLKEKLKSSNSLLVSAKVSANSSKEKTANQNRVNNTKVKSTQKVNKNKKYRKNKKVVSRKNIKRNRFLSYEGNLSTDLINKFLEIQNLINLRNFSQAKHDLYEVDKKRPNLATTLNLLAYIELESGNYNTARAFLDRTEMLKKSDVMTKRLFDLLNKLDGNNNPEEKK